MANFGSVKEVKAAAAREKARCEASGVPFFADALAAALFVPYETLERAAAGHGVCPALAAALSAALQECTASVLEAAMKSDAKAQAFYMWYLRNRAGFSDRERGGVADAVTFVGEI